MVEGFHELRIAEYASSSGSSSERYHRSPRVTEGKITGGGKRTKADGETGALVAVATGTADSPNGKRSSDGCEASRVYRDLENEMPAELPKPNAGTAMWGSERRKTRKMDGRRDEGLGAYNTEWGHSRNGEGGRARTC